jgi:DNA-binding SARP family transcriptional activator
MAYPQPYIVTPRAELLPSQDSAATFQIRCFGTFSLTIHGRPFDLEVLRPRIRRLLRLLAFRGGRPVHREVLTETLWPGTDPATGGRNLHVAISTLRHVLEPDLVGGAARSLIRREGETYLLYLPPDAFVDVVEFDRRLAAAKSATHRNDAAEAVREFRRALALSGAELLPEEGPSDWIVKERDRRALDISELAGTLAEALLSAGEPSEAAWVCRRGIQVDRYHDALWRILAQACELAGDLASSARARRDYRALLLELGVLASPRARTEEGVSGNFQRLLEKS